MQSPERRTPDDVREELRMLRETRPHEYAREAARLLKELERLERKRGGYALT